MGANIVVENGRFYVHHLTAKDTDEISSFAVDDSRGKGLEDYIRLQAMNDEMQSIMRTYLVRMKGNNKIIAYFSLKAGLISHGEVRISDRVVFDTLPGVELANFAVNSHLIKQYGMKGVGYMVFADFIYPMVEAISRMLGVKLIYIFALPYEKLIQRYEEYNFQRLPEDAEKQLHARLKPVYDEGCIFMYQLFNEG